MCDIQWEFFFFGNHDLYNVTMTMTLGK